MKTTTMSNRHAIRVLMAMRDARLSQRIDVAEGRRRLDDDERAEWLATIDQQVEALNTAITALRTRT